MPVIKEKSLKLIAELICHMSGFKSGDENYDICMDYALSNIKYHKFLDPDSKKITRSIEGLATKLRIHCQDEKARILEDSVASFLEFPAFEYRESGKTDTHWAVLSLLLKLSNSPLTSDYVPSQKVIKKKEEDTFDWYAYLTEGLEPYIPPSDDSSDDDYDLESEENTKHNVTFAPEISENVNGQSKVVHERHKTSDEHWLEENVVVEYWKHGQTVHTSSHESSRFNIHWEENLTQNVDLYVSEESIQLTEYQVVRESIWLLMGAEKSFLVIDTGESWKIRPNVQLSHITHAALESSLYEIIKYSTIIRKTQRFLESTPSADEQVPQTYQAFRGALWEFHSQFQQYLTQIEKSFLKQEETATITNLLRIISTRLRDFDVIDHILRHGIDTCQNMSDNGVKACTLLAAMFNLMTSCHVLSDDSTQANLVLSLWVRSCKPYLERIDKWLYEGVLHDPGHEFIIRENEGVEEESYWDKGFTLHCTAPPDQGDAAQDAQFAPVFLVPVLQQLIMAGKSMTLLFKLGKAKQVYPGSSRQTLYEAFISSIEEFLGISTQENSEFLPGREQISTPDTLFTDHIEKQLALKQMEDPLLRLNFAQFLKRNIDLRDAVPKEEHLAKALSEVQLNPLTPIQLMLRHCLYSHITARYETVCSNLLEVLKNEYQLFSYFQAVKRYYLMEAGDTMYDFCTELFEKLRHREEWKDLSYLNVVMQDCLHARFPQDERSLFVGVEEEESKSRDRMPIKALDPIFLEYKIPWPVSTILNTKCMSVYNTVFRFLLMIKRAKYGLDGLRFSDLEKTIDYDAMSTSADDSVLDTSTVEPSRDQIKREMHMLRFKLLCFTNSLHNYIMTRIVHSTSMEFEASLEKSSDLDDVIKAHNQYVKTLHERCLQHKESKFTKEILTRILNLAVKFCTLWDQGIHQIKIKKIQEVESEYSKSVQFLRTFFNNVIKRGSFTHLEPLAFALDSSYIQKSTR